MPEYASKKQMRWFHTKTAKAKGITQAEIDKRDAASKGMDLPERSTKSMKIKAKVRYKKKGAKA